MSFLVPTAVPLLLLALAGPPPPPVAPTDVRGITVSCWTWGGEWAEPGMRELMSTLPDVGANWLAIHPYARVSRSTGRVGFDPSRPLDHVVRPIRWARELGLDILVKPHLSYWGEFAWRGEVGWPPGDARWTVFRESYRNWILHLAEVCEKEGASLFAVGTELRRTEAMRAWWTGLIRDVRARFHGPLTYAANWDDYERVSFWSELDLIGVQAYFPLAEEADPSAATLRRAWREHAGRLAAFSRERGGQPVLLAEVGYDASPWAAARPWETWRGAPRTDVQERCLRAALEAVERTPEIAGAFVWKWFPTVRSQGPADFTVQTPHFKRVLRETWSPRVGPAVK